MAGFGTGRKAGQVVERRYPPRERPDVFIRVAGRDGEDERRELVARIEALPVDFRKSCFAAPIGEDPIYPVIRTLYPDGATLRDIGRAYGLTLERVRQIGDVAKDRVFALIDGHVIERGPSVWDDLEAAS